jgi:hypothetical protein
MHVIANSDCHPPRRQSPWDDLTRGGDETRVAISVGSAGSGSGKVGPRVGGLSLLGETGPRVSLACPWPCFDPENHDPGASLGTLPF